MTYETGKLEAYPTTAGRNAYPTEINPQSLTPNHRFLIFAFQIASGVLNGVEKEA
jgi:hypothetical protein